MKTEFYISCFTLCNATVFVPVHTYTSHHSHHSLLTSFTLNTSAKTPLKSLDSLLCSLLYSPASSTLAWWSYFAFCNLYCCLAESYFLLPPINKWRGCAFALVFSRAACFCTSVELCPCQKNTDEPKTSVLACQFQPLTLESRLVFLEKPLCKCNCHTAWPPPLISGDIPSGNWPHHKELYWVA